MQRQAFVEAVSANSTGSSGQSARISPSPEKFLRDGFVGLLRAGRPVTSRMARKLPDRGTQFLSRLDRLEGHLNASDALDGKVKAGLPNLWFPMAQQDTPIILDLSDIAKPLARKMDYLATVRNGSNGQRVNRYWLVELYASVSRKNPVPVLVEPFSHEQPFYAGPDPIIDAVRWAFELTHDLCRSGREPSGFLGRGSKRPV